MRPLVLAAAALFSAFALAQEQGAGSRAPAKAVSHSKWTQKTGGYVMRPAVGRIVVVNCQAKVPRKTVAEKTAALRQFLPVDVTCVDGLPIPAADVFATCRRRADGASAALFVVDDPALPQSLMCPDEQWALVNVANAASDVRFDRLFARGAVMAFGGGVSQYENSPMQTVRTPKDLDRLAKTTMAIDNVIAIQRNLAALGVRSSQRVTYLQACKEGWAPAPTNDYQKAIWDKVHEIPTEPIKIKYEGKNKGK